MKKLLKYISFIILFFAFLIIFLPKERLFNYTLNIASKYNVLLKTYTFKDDYFTFDIKDINIYYENIQAFKIDNLKLNTYILNNNLLIKNIKIDDSLKQFVPSNVDNVKLSHTFLNPLYLDILIYSKDFKIDGKYDIFNKSIKLKLKPSKAFKIKYSKIISNFKYNNKTKDYTYEYKL